MAINRNKKLNSIPKANARTIEKRSEKIHIKTNKPCIIKNHQAKALVFVLGESVLTMHKIIKQLQLFSLYIFLQAVLHTVNNHATGLSTNPNRDILLAKKSRLLCKNLKDSLNFYQQ